MYLHAQSQSKNRFRIFFMFCMILLFVICEFSVVNASQLENVRIGFFKSEKYGYVGTHGDLRGYDVHLSKVIAVYGDFEAEMIGYDSVTEMENALRNHDVDVLIDFLHTDKRDHEFIFTETPIMQEKVCLYTINSPDAPTPDQLTKIESLRVGYESNSGFLDYFLDYCAERKITPQLVSFDHEFEMRNAMLHGEIDACLTGSSVPPGYRLLLSTVSLASYMMLRSDDVALCKRIEFATQQLVTDNPNYMNELYNQYITSREEILSPLTLQEREYLAAHPVISVALVRGAEPFVVEKSSGILSGVVPDYYRVLGKKLGISFTFVAYARTDEAIDAVSKGKIDILGQYYGDIIIAGRYGLIDTLKYGMTSCARLTRSGFNAQAKTASVTDRTFYSLSDQLNQDITLKTYSNVEDCYQALMSRKVDSMIGSMPAVTWLINQHTLRGVNLSFLPNISLGLRGAVSQENRTLLFILNKVIASSKTALDLAILENAVSGETSLRTAIEKIPLGLSLSIVAILAILVMLLIITLVRLNHNNRERVDMLNREIARDTLTGAGSRRYGIELINRELLLNRYQGEENNTMLAMLDIDFFKDKNDTFGHEYGDFVLKKLVQILHKTLRQSDVVIRWGGDEFILVCSQIHDNGAQIVLEKIIHAINSSEFIMNGKGEQVTISVGAAFFRHDDENIEAILRRCDEALYAAKKVRNSYRIFPTKPD